ncbi:hypothetical protein OIU82_00035 [Escherichia coli]|nr:hypothetical protein [Escherichia coli]
MTARDVTASTGAAKPAVSDFLKPSDKPDFTLPADTTGTTPTNPSTGEQVNLGDDPGIGPPELENIPAGTEILSPLLSFNPLKIQPMHLMQKAKELNMRSVQNLYWRFLTDNIS